MAEEKGQLPVTSASSLSVVKKTRTLILKVRCLRACVRACLRACAPARPPSCRFLSATLLTSHALHPAAMCDVVDLSRRLATKSAELKFSAEVNSDRDLEKWIVAFQQRGVQTTRGY